MRATSTNHLTRKGFQVVVGACSCSLPPPPKKKEKNNQQPTTSTMTKEQINKQHPRIVEIAFQEILRAYLAENKGIPDNQQIKSIGPAITRASIRLASEFMGERMFASTSEEETQTTV